MTCRPIQAHFHCGSAITALTLLHSLTRWSVLQKVRCHPKAPSLKSIKFRFYFTPLRGSFHLSLMVLVHYRSRVLFSLEVGSQIQTRLHVPDPTREIVDTHKNIFNTGLSPLWQVPRFP